MPLDSQSFIGPYRLLAPLRTGRYTQVWTAIHDSQARYVAVKMLLPEFRKDAEQLRTIRHELEVGLKLEHPRCLRPFDLITSKAGPCLLMPLVRGDNLRDVLKHRREWVQRRFRSIVLQAAEAIVYLHSLGYLHLDVKPDNFLYSDEKGVQLIDFALVRRLPNAWERFFWKNRQLTIQGTRSYMAPEQIRKQPVDAATDVYAFGCSLYQLATGIPPFTAASSTELLMKHLHTRIPNVITDNPDATPEFAELLRRMLAKAQADRPQSFADLASQLRELRFFRSHSADDEEENSENLALSRQNAG